MSHAHTRTLAQQLSGAFLAFGVLVAAAFLTIALMYAVSWTWLTPELERANLAVKAESDAFTAMLDQETGLRAYLLTHDVRFVQPYAGGRLSLALANDDLARNVGAESGLAKALVSTRVAEERWHERWAVAAADTRSGAIPPSMLDGKLLFDAYRLEQRALADALGRHVDLLSRREKRMVATRVALQLAVLLAVLVQAVRQNRALRTSIVGPVAELLAHIRRVRDGQLMATVDPAGPRELAELGEGLNEMVSALAEARAAAASRDEAIRIHSGRLRQVLDASREFSESLNLNYVVGAVRASTLAVGGYERVIVWLMDDEQKRLVDSDENEGAARADASIKEEHWLAGRAAKSGRITFEGPAGAVRFSDGDEGPVRAIAIPLVVGARVVGVLEARNSEPRLATTDMVEITEMLATHAATAIESARLHEIIEGRSHVDALTRLLNRRRLDDDLDAECQRCVRYARPLALVMLDVDHFKAFNDSHGHPQGDEALRQVADVIAGCVRVTDTAYRYGGEEFCILLRETSGGDALIFAERVRRRIERRFASGPMAGITASLGVAEFSTQTPNPRALLEAADAAMYESKRVGRNRALLSSAPPSPPAADAPGLPS